MHSIYSLTHRNFSMLKMMIHFMIHFYPAIREPTACCMNTSGSPQVALGTLAAVCPLVAVVADAGACGGEAGAG